jgi:hypothetical protein
VLILAHRLSKVSTRHSLLSNYDEIGTPLKSSHSASASAKLEIRSQHIQHGSQISIQLRAHGQALMRLLDLIAQCREPFIVVPRAHGAPMVVSGPGDFAQRIAECPLRLVIADDLTRASAELAFADGDRLVGCLDLLRIPAPRLWVEWSDAIHQQVISQCGTVAQGDPDAFGRQVGVLLQAAPCGRSALARTFWSVPNAAGKFDAQMSPIETHISLDTRFNPAANASEILRGRYVSLTHSPNSGVDDLLDRVRFRFDERWLQYYEQAASDTDSRQNVIRGSLAAVAHDIPLLLAFFLLLNAKGATRSVPIERSALNRKRLARDRAALLDHVEVHASIPGYSTASEDDVEGGCGTRRAPRLHHVRGHLVRREDRVFWRMPHLRGSALQGVVRSRTVCLSFRLRAS